MTVAVVALLTIAVTVVAAVAGGWWWRTSSVYRSHRSSTVIVNLTTDAVFRGVLWSDDGTLLVLRNAEMMYQGDRQPVDGEVVIERDRVEFIQKVS